MPFLTANWIQPTYCTKAPLSLQDQIELLYPILSAFDLTAFLTAYADASIKVLIIEELALLRTRILEKAFILIYQQRY